MPCFKRIIALGTILWDINVAYAFESQGNVATRLRCGAIINNYFCKFTAEHVSERNLNIGQYLMKF